MGDDHATTVTLTGTGVPHPSPGRAGAGVLVRHGDVAVQFDAGRGTVLRLAEAGCGTHELDAMFITHAHSDHVVDLADVVMTRWIQSTLHPSGPLPIVAVDGQATRFAGTMLDAYVDDIALRVEHVQPAPPQLDVRPFALPAGRAQVWCSDDGSVRVEAVAYRVSTPSGVVVVSGDTRVCEEVRDLARGADLLVHEACRTTTMAALVAGTPFERIFDYHADTVALGRLAADAGVGQLLLTHLIPPPADAGAEAEFAADVRRGGYDGPLAVGRDLMTVELTAGGPR